MANHWLFQIMHDRFPTLWDSSLRYGIAAQHYPPGWHREASTLDRMRSMSSGDKILAAFKGHRFAGHGVLTSDFNRTDPPLNIKDGSGKRLTFRERFDCDWKVIPFHRDPAFITCHDLKKEGFAIDLLRGQAIQPISKDTFDAVAGRLDSAGAAAHRNAWVVKAQIGTRDRSGWHWQEYFDNPMEATNWGGPNWINSPLSKQLLRDSVATDDLVVMYQQDTKQPQRAIVGFTRMASEGKEFYPGTATYDCFDLADPSEAYLLKEPLTIEALRSTGTSPECFGMGAYGTVHPLYGGELRGIINAVVQTSPADADDFLMWLDDIGVPGRSLDGGSSFSPTRNDAWDDGCSEDDIDALLEQLEKRFKKRTDVYIKRLVRQWVRQDRPFIRALKKKYGHSCQFPGCSAQIPMRSGLNYCEVAHVTPVSKGGKALRLNLVVLCPNHHKMFDHGTLVVEATSRTSLKGVLNGSRFAIRR